MKRSCLHITWQTKEIRGYVDIFAPDEFASATGSARRTHLVRGPRGWIGTATYHLVLEPLVATLDYAAFPAENERAQMEQGRMRITFGDTAREAVRKVEWGDGSGGRFQRADVRISMEPYPGLPDYRPEAGKGRRRLMSTKERPGQAKFRNLLSVVYGGRCAITDCPVASALDGAHIDPFENPTYDSAQNGLLLRKDIHRLFDAGLLTIDPVARTVAIADEAGEWREYRRLSGRKLREPEPLFRASRPSGDALERRAGRPKID